MTRAGFRIGTALLAVLALWEIWTTVSVAHGAQDEDWKRASDIVRAAFRQGDLIVFAPAWADPVGRYWLGDLIPIADAGRMDAERYPRILEVSIRGANAPEADGAEEEAAMDVGALRVRRLVRVSPVVTWDLRSCSRLCAVDFQPRHGILLRLGQAGATRRATFPNAQLGSELHVCAGLIREDLGWRPGPAARLRVLVDGRVVSTALVGPESAWRPLPVAGTEPGSHEVAFEASVAESTAHVDLDLCVAAEGRRPR